MMSPDMDTNSVDAEQARAVFAKFDANGDGRIDADELAKAMREMGREYSEERIAELIDEIDENHDGFIDAEEFRVMVGKSWFMEMYRNKMATATTDALSKIVANHETGAGIYRESILHGLGSLPIDAVDDDEKEELSGIDEDDVDDESEEDLDEMDRDELIALLDEQREQTSLWKNKVKT